jgi:Zn-dependent M28 family amino/carboxypeptidase
MRALGRWMRGVSLGFLVLLLAHAQAGQAAAESFSGAKALAYTTQFVNATGARYNGSPGLAKAQAFLKHAFAHDQLEDDAFTSNTPEGPQQMHNYIVRFPGKKDGVIVIATHYETNYWLRDVNFVGANDGGATTGLLLELANHLRGHTLEGYSVWLVFFDGEESVEPQWSDSDSLYGSRHLAARWAADGTLQRIKAFLLTDMIGDKSLNIDRDTYSTPWLLDLIKKAADDEGYGSYFFAKTNTVEDDHKPFAKRGVPCADIIDIEYGPASDPSGPGTFHHTIKDTLDKLSAKSLTISGSVLLETIRLLDQR